MAFFDVVDRISQKMFYTLSFWRGKRIFHPRGKVYAGTMTITEPQALPACVLFSAALSYRVIVRLSRGIGLPKGFPDILGIAIRVPDVYGNGLHQDILMVTSGKGPLTRYGMFFANRFSTSIFSTILPYRIHEKKYLFGIFPSEKYSESIPQFTLGIASPMGPWQKVGEIRLDERLLPQEYSPLAYNPWNTGGGIEPAGFIQRLRKNAYRASQAGRKKAHLVNTPTY